MLSAQIVAGSLEKLQTTYLARLSLRTHCTGCPLRAGWPCSAALGGPNHCSGVLRSHFALDTAVQASLFSATALGKYRPGDVFSHMSFEITAQVCLATTALEIIARACFEAG